MTYKKPHSESTSHMHALHFRIMSLPLLVKFESDFENNYGKTRVDQNLDWQVQGGPTGQSMKAGHSVFCMGSLFIYINAGNK